MFVSSWSPEFTPDSPPLTSADVAVELRGVPYLLFNKESLCRIATAVGTPVAMAPETERKENFEVVKLMVRVNLHKELPSKIISGFSNGREVEITVTYPWLPLQSQGCKQFGYSDLRCPVKHLVHPPNTRSRKSRTSRSRTPLPRDSTGFKTHTRKGRSWRPIKKIIPLVSDESDGFQADILLKSPGADTDALTSIASSSQGVVLESEKVESVVGVVQEVVVEYEKSANKSDTSSNIVAEAGGVVVVHELQDHDLGIVSTPNPSECGSLQDSMPMVVNSMVCGSAVGSAVVEEEEQPFILVSCRKGGRRTTKLH
ncbi:uncharacterized protein LOC110224398 [Arabidopsis lyrata subsp. lyrata]|uniref:uncharacterized protein LOC110224398 n=1 Tax=Arabidopsis lyrata subsp. lyrata TaxID=81972 RepID=UPI000A29D8DC|nr:uncharacterized protein LOC110224398 [Arabidopsis lyrata subsp. lyrata]|eukprot:XP_020866106.1 uncharacterized protein LOC110224398 [Arabidopsis lyrata subsp. lyrata]